MGYKSLTRQQQCWSVRSGNSERHRLLDLVVTIFHACKIYLNATLSFLLFTRRTGFSILPPKLDNPPRRPRKQHHPDQRRRGQANRLRTVLPTQLAPRHHQRPDRLALLDGPGNHAVSRRHVRQQGGRVVPGDHRHRVGGRKVSVRNHASFPSHVSGRQKSSAYPIPACQLERQLQRLHQRVSDRN